MMIFRNERDLTSLPRIDIGAFDEADFQRAPSGTLVSDNDDIRKRSAQG